MFVRTRPQWGGGLRCQTGKTARAIRVSASSEPQTKATEPGQASRKYELKVEGKPFTIGEGQALAVAGASLGLPLRLGFGALTAGYKAGIKEKQEGQYSFGAYGRSLDETSAVSTFKRPEKPLIMYEFDACPFCKKVREMCSYLDIECLYKPCPKDGPTFRPEGTQKSGKSMFPYMEDPNTGTSMLESDDIIKYLAETYGDGQVPLQLRLGVFGTTLPAGLSALGRMGRGGRYRAASMPAEPLVVWGYEPSPFVRLVKEALCELELPHYFKPCARGSPNRQKMFDVYGKFQVPLLEDPNTGIAMFESAEIVKYLEKTYAKSDVAGPASA